MNNLLIEVYVQETGDYDLEEIQDMIIAQLEAILTNAAFYPADDPEDTGLFFNAAPLDNELGADVIYSVGTWCLEDVADASFVVANCLAENIPGYLGCEVEVA